MTKITIMPRKDAVGKDGKAPLNAVFSLRGEKVRIPIGISVKDSEWDSTHCRIRGKSKETEDNNLIIEKTRAKITELFVRQRLSGIPLNKLNFLNEIKKFDVPEDFYSYASEQLKKYRKSISETTANHHETVLKKMKEYAPKLNFDEITTDWIKGYVRHLREVKGNALSTIRKNLSMIRVYCDKAFRDGKMTDRPFDDYSVHSERPTVVFLKEEELEKLTSLYRSGTLADSRQDVLRFFLFMTFTGMHISDARALTIEQTYDDRIVYRRMKTGTSVIMPMSGPTTKLVDYYAGGRSRGPLFQKLPTDQAFNRVIKIVCRMAGIRKPVSAKTGRHTFATLYLTKNPGDITTLSRLLGHTNIETTMAYVHTLREDKEKGVSVFDGML
ncbi:MAG: site-specific integrase [Muribaculaceae bacterium]|nr:site-specific integrase [Muribaculaceae bacterium]